LNAIASLILSLIVVFILLRLKIHVSLAIFFGAFILAFINLQSLAETFYVLENTLLALQTWRLVVIISSAIGLSIAMDLKGMLKDLAKTLEKAGEKIALHVAPPLIGLVPMPAGALVSASMVRDLAKRLKLTPEEATFINYWFRHIMEYSWPIYQGIILTSAIFSINVVDVIKTLSPMTFFNALIGLLISYMIFKRKVSKHVKDRKGFSMRSFVKDLILSSWPILLIIFLILLLKLDTSLAFILSLTTLIIVERFNVKDLVKVVKDALNPKIVLLSISTMFYKAVVEYANLPHQIFSILTKIGVPDYVVLMLLPFIVGFATGITFAFVGITFPLLAPIVGRGIIDAGSLVLAYASGFAGVLLSPMHLCLILSAEYFKADLPKTYVYIIPAVALSLIIASIVYIVA